MPEKGPGRRKDIDKGACLCSADPWRYNSLRVSGDIGKLEQEQVSLWGRLDAMVTVKMFSLFITALTTIVIAFCASMYDTNKQTLAIVTQINEKVIKLETRREFIGFGHPDDSRSFNGDKPSLIGSIIGRYPAPVR